MVRRFEENVAGRGADMRGSQPSVGNMAGGITTIEEESLGAVCKAGGSALQGVVEYGVRPDGRGLYFMDAPGRDLESVTGLVAGGCQLVLFTTGRGAPQGFPVAPVVKITANAGTASFLGEHIDLDVSGVMARTQTMAEAAQAIYRKALAVASGEATKAELIGYTETLNIYVKGPVL